jgi:ferritin-like metal-binding protein YciE
MPAEAIRDQLVKHLTDAHAMEQEALAQLRRACDDAGDEGRLAELFREHLEQSHDHERLVRERLDACGAAPSRVKDFALKVAGATVGRLPRRQPDTAAKLVAYGYAAEQLELATYELLRLVAERAGDDETVAAATRIRDDERAMADRLMSALDEAVQASLPEHGETKSEERLEGLLADLHAVEAQSVTLLDRGQRLAGDSDVAAVYREHLEQSVEHVRLLEERLRKRGASASAIEDGVLRLSAMNLAAFFEARPDTAEKVVASAFAAEHLEIVLYEQLRRMAQETGDGDTAEVAERILGEERAAAERIAGAFPAAVEASLHAQGVAASRPAS